MSRSATLDIPEEFSVTLFREEIDLFHFLQAGQSEPCSAVIDQSFANHLSIVACLLTMSYGGGSASEML